MPETKIKIYQNFFKDDQLPFLDAGFVPHDWRHNPHPEYREIYLFLEAHRLCRHLEADYVGIVSQKFGEKTGLTGRQFRSFIERNPGYDVYFVNPFPDEGYKHFNVWDQGEDCHPGLCELAQDLFHSAGYTVSVNALGRNNHSTLLYCNYWVGNRTFWDAYIAFVKPLFECVVRRMREKTRQRYFAIARHSEPIPFFPFVFERMFSTLLLIDPSLRACPYQYSEEGFGIDNGSKAVGKHVARHVLDRIDNSAFISKNTRLHRGLFRQFHEGYKHLVRAGGLYRRLLRRAKRRNDNSWSTRATP